MPPLRPGPAFGMPPALAKYRSPVAYVFPPVTGGLDMTGTAYGFGWAGGELASVQSVSGTLTGSGDGDAMLEGFVKSPAITGATVTLFADYDPERLNLVNP